MAKYFLLFGAVLLGILIVGLNLSRNPVLRGPTAQTAEPPTPVTPSPSPSMSLPEGFQRVQAATRSSGDVPMGMRWLQPGEYDCGIHSAGQCWGLEVISSQDCRLLMVSGATIDSQGRNVDSVMDNRPDVRAGQRTVLVLTSLRDEPVRLQPNRLEGW